MVFHSPGKKAPAAHAAGADAVALYTENWTKRAKDFGAESGAGKTGVDVAYDSVGATLEDSLTAARTGGAVVFYGMAGGDPKAVDPRRMMDESKTLTGGDLWNVLTTRDEREKRAGEVFKWIVEGKLKVNVAARFSLADGARAHALFESRRAIGKVLLTV